MLSLFVTYRLYCAIIKVSWSRLNKNVTHMCLLCEVYPVFNGMPAVETANMSPS